MDSKKFICSCFLYKNIFIKRFNIHVTYESGNQFKEDYHEVLRSLGCKENELEDIHTEVVAEINRRKSNGIKSKLRRELISKNYKPLHTELYSLKEHFFVQEFLELCNLSRLENTRKYDLLKKMYQHKASHVYSFNIFTDEFCEKFTEEMKHFEASDLPKGRPNSMNTTGILLDELGFYPTFINPLQENYLAPLIALLYPQLYGPSGLDSQRSFVVSYDFRKSGDETDLNLHYDNAEVTINIGLNKQFAGGELYFSNMKNEPNDGVFNKVEHKQGYGVLHRGAHFHGAMPLEDGERYNLIIWMRSSSVRNRICPMCDQIPNIIETQGDGDGFINTPIQVCNLV